MRDRPTQNIRTNPAQAKPKHSSNIPQSVQYFPITATHQTLTDLSRAIKSQTLDCCCAALVEAEEGDRFRSRRDPVFRGDGGGVKVDEFASGSICSHWPQK
jgi:hypothetical protein